MVDGNTWGIAMSLSSLVKNGQKKLDKIIQSASSYNIWILLMNWMSKPNSEF